MATRVRIAFVQFGPGFLCRLEVSSEFRNGEVALGSGFALYSFGLGDGLARKDFRSEGCGRGLTFPGVARFMTT